jgi:site-specific DNA recombinase
MKKAVFYARVSSDLQREAKTIDSQIDALKKQIADSGNILVKEYIDDGWSGAQLDRPAMDELRSDLKKNIFDTIYFHNTDRIARDVTYQTIIIAEILKAEKQIIINGKDYVHNPENKFTLTVLGAVAELEKAKIVERSKRGKQLKLKQGVLMGGANMFGYNYILKTPTSPGRMEINEHEAEIVRFVFNEYAKGDKSMTAISRALEDMGALTKNGKKLWGLSNLQHLLNRKTYTGIMYFNTLKTVTEYGNPLSGTKTSMKLIPRDKSEWISIPIPAIISEEVFNKVQERLKLNRKRYRGPNKTQLLSWLIRCGYCGIKFYAFRRYLTWKRVDGSKGMYLRAAYRCAKKLWRVQHSKKSGAPSCQSREIASHFLEGYISTAIENIMLDPVKLHEWMDIFRTKRPHARIERELNKLGKILQSRQTRKDRIAHIYAMGDLTREEYVEKSRVYDEEIAELTTRKLSLVQQIPFFRNAKLVDTAIQQYCEGAKVRYKKCVDFETRRQFLLDYVEQITYWNDKIALHGSVPIVIESNDKKGGKETKKLGFKIEVKNPVAHTLPKI